MTIKLEPIDFTHKKQAIPKLQQVIHTIKTKQAEMYQFGVIVDLIAKQYKHQTMALQRAIAELDDKEAQVNVKVHQMERLQEQLLVHQQETEHHLRQTQRHVAIQRQQRSLCEHRYALTHRVPLFSKRAERKYIQARDQSLAVEQQLAELRHELERCRRHVNRMIQSSAQQCNQKGQLRFQRRGSVDVLHHKKGYLEDLQRGCAFWSQFDVHQAQVILESAAHLLRTKGRPSHGPLDVEALWIKMFEVTCAEYNQLLEEGDRQWGTLEIQYECEMGQHTVMGWPHLEEGRLVCDQCQQKQSVFGPDTSYKRLFHALFQTPKIYPL